MNHKLLCNELPVKEFFILIMALPVFGCRGVIASLNIAVFLFEIASPIRSAELELVSIPMLYGAKINDLIVSGEWWRLVTPMFLVQD